MFIELIRTFAALEQFHHVTQPLVRANGGGIRLIHFFTVSPVRRDSAFGDIVHFLRADLNFDPLVFRTHDRGVNGTVAIGFRQGDEILEPLRHHAPGLMQNAKCAITILDRGYHSTKTKHVRKLFKIGFLVLQLPPNRIRPLGPPLHPGLDAVFRQLSADFVGNASNPAGGSARLGIYDRECQVFQLLAHILHADSPGERRINLDGFLRDP